MDFDIEMEDAALADPNDVPRVDEELLDDAPSNDILPMDDDAQEPGEIDESAEPAKQAGHAGGGDSGADDEMTLVPHKVYLRGLDAMNPTDLKAYVAEHTASSGAGASALVRIEWIDDSSANLVFDSASSAAAALAAMCALAIEDPDHLPVRELLPAKPFGAKPDVASLQLRFSTAADKKQAGAAARSRFYLLHPEYDPEERLRHRSHSHSHSNNRSYRDRGSVRQGGHYRDRRDDRDNRDDQADNSFDVSLYDDDPSALAKRSSRTRSRSPRPSRTRFRSRSPSQPRSSPSMSRSRSRSPGTSRRPRRQGYSSLNRGKELFPAKDNELFPEKLASTSERRALTPARDRDRKRQGRDRDWDQTGRLSGRLSESPPRGGNGNGNGNYHDSDADYDGRLADERALAAAEAAARNRNKARAIKDRLSSRGESGAKELFPASTSAVTARLSDRISRPSDYVPATLADTEDRAESAASSTFNIRGLAKSTAGSGETGLTIKGVASARELFPNLRDGRSGNGRRRHDERDRLNDHNDADDDSDYRRQNAKKEVFSGSLKDRIRPRQRAEDMFR